MLPQAVPTLSNPFGDAALLMGLSGPYSTGNMIYPPTGNNTNDASFSMPMQPPVFPFQFSMPFQPDQLLLLQQQQQQLLLQQQQLLNWRNFAFPSTGIPAPAPQPEPTVTLKRGLEPATNQSQLTLIKSLLKPDDPRPVWRLTNEVKLMLTKSFFGSTGDLYLLDVESSTEHNVALWRRAGLRTVVVVNRQRHESMPFAKGEPRPTFACHDMGKSHLSSIDPRQPTLIFDLSVVDFTVHKHYDSMQSLDHLFDNISTHVKPKGLVISLFDWSTSAQNERQSGTKRARMSYVSLHGNKYDDISGSESGILCKEDLVLKLADEHGLEPVNVYPSPGGKYTRSQDCCKSFKHLDRYSFRGPHGLTERQLDNLDNYVVLVLRKKAQ